MIRKLLGLILLVPLLSNAEETTADFPVCSNYSATQEVWKAIDNKDDRQFEALTQGGDCYNVKAGVQLSIINKIGVIYKIRLYIGEKSLEMFTSQAGFK